MILKPGKRRLRAQRALARRLLPAAHAPGGRASAAQGAGYLDRVDVRARIHGGGISSQADAVRHGIAKALIEADPDLRGELKRRQLLTRDPRVKERRKAGLKKARKRPQFSKR